MEPLREDLRDGTRGRSPPRKEEDDATLLGILDACEEKLRHGEAIDRDEILRKHPGLRERLAACLSGLELVRRAGRALEVGAAAPDGSGRSLSLLALGDFRNLREVRRGGMGIVYEAEQVSLARRVALK